MVLLAYTYKLIFLVVKNVTLRQMEVLWMPK
jgi:hypothetical protein